MKECKYYRQPGRPDLLELFFFFGVGRSASIITIKKIYWI